MSKLAEDVRLIHDRELIATLDLHNPQFERRSFVLRMRGSKEQELTLRLQVLVPSSMYLVLEDGYGLKSGQVLIRNLEMMRRLGCAGAPYDKQMFVRYDNLFDAWRAMSRLNPTYKAEEIPAMDAWQRSSDELMELAWSLEVRNVAQHHEYKVRAWEAVKPHANVVNPNKVEARAQHVRATELQDRRGRFNAGRLPLMLGSIDVAVWKRIREVRSIGHRMDFRAMVLELYIHKLSEMVERTRLDLVQLLRVNGVFGKGPNRTPRKVEEVARRVRGTAKHLDTLVARPFEHVFQNVAMDFEEAAALMEEAAANREPIKMDEAKLYVHRAYRSLVLFQQGCLIHEVLASVAAIHHRKQGWGKDVFPDAKDILESAVYKIRTGEWFTNEPFEQGFRRPIVDRVVVSLQAALGRLEMLETEPHSTKHLTELHKQLKLAVAPF